MSDLREQIASLIGDTALEGDLILYDEFCERLADRILAIPAIENGLALWAAHTELMVYGASAVKIEHVDLTEHLPIAKGD